MKIKQEILKTLVFYHIFQRPLRLKELWQGLGLKVNQESFKDALIELKNEKKIQEKFGLWSISAHDFDFFLKRAKINREFLKKGRSIGKILGYLPFVRMVAVINSVSFGAAKDESDIDILIVSAKNRLWTARALVVASLEIMGINKQVNQTAGRFCLGFAFDEKTLKLEPLRLFPRDTYFNYWLAHLLPVYDEKTYTKLVQANEWLKKALPNWQNKDIDFAKPNQFKIMIEKVMSKKFGQILENFLRSIQIKKIWNDPKSSHLGGSVIASQHMMKLHPFDKRFYYQKTLDRELLRLLK